MKKLLYTILFATLLFISPFASGDNPPPPPGDLPNQGGGNYVGGGAPIGEGLIFMMLFAAGYGSRKFNQQQRKKGL